MRYLPLSDQDRAEMLDTIGAESVDTFFEDIPASARLDGLLDLPRAAGELEVERAMSKLARANRAAGDGPFFLGAGAYRHHVPATVDHIIQRSEFLTSYTPYQPEIAQGTLQYLFEFQTQVAMLTGMEIANASMYDGSTACAEAMVMARRVTKRSRVVISNGLHPHYRSVVETAMIDDAPVYPSESIDPGVDEDLASMIDDQTACVIVQYPDVFGRIRDFTALADAAHAKGALLIVAFTEAVALGALKAPGDMGADIVVGEGQSIGNPLNFGGPYVGLFATRKKLVRQMPGRVAGETVDADGRRGFVLTLSTREQHIRREKATSNICTNSGLCCLAFTVHMTLLGEAGLRRLAMLNHHKALDLASALADIPGVEVLNTDFFNEFTLRLNQPAAQVVDRLADEGVIAGAPGGRLWPGHQEAENLLIVTATETVCDEDIQEFSDALRKVLS